MASIKIKWTVVELDNVLTVYDQVKVYRSTTGYGGTYAEITGPGTRVALVSGQTLYEYIDTTGDPTYWYRTAYYDSVTAAESTPSDPIIGDSPGLYCTVQDIRDEGFDDTTYSDQRVINTITLASRMIERVTSRWFEPRSMDYLLDGRTSQTLRLGHPIISVSNVYLDDDEVLVSDLKVYNRHITSALTNPDDREDPRIELYRDYASEHTIGYPAEWPRGQQNVRVVGVFGYTDYDGTSTGKTPDLIVHLCKLLVSRELELISDSYSRSSRRDFWRKVQDRTRDQSITVASPVTSPLASLARGMLTGDPEIDSLIMAYRKPMAMASI